MRVRNGDGLDAAHCLDCLDDGFVEQGHTIPEDVHFCRSEEQGTLADGEGGLDTNTDQTWLLRLQRVAVGDSELVQGCPLLAGLLDILAFILTDGARRGRLIALGELGSTGRANEVRHDVHHFLPSSKSTAQQPSTCSPGWRQWFRISESVQPASSSASAKTGKSLKSRSS